MSKFPFDFKAKELYCGKAGHARDGIGSGGNRQADNMDDAKIKNLFKSISAKAPAGRRASGAHIVVCPFCETGHPVPVDFDSIHRCTCGACYKVCANDTLESGVGDIASTLWNDEELDFVRQVPVDFCNIIIEKNFDRLLNLKQTSKEDAGIERFCKYDINLHLSLVWVKRLF
jgi:hypothetical protein